MVQELIAYNQNNKSRSPVENGNRIENLLKFCSLKGINLYFNFGSLFI